LVIAVTLSPRHRATTDRSPYLSTWSWPPADILLKHRIVPDGYTRDTIFYTITDDEWLLVKARLEAKLSGQERAGESQLGG
jgi:hypothetical protein